MAIVGSTAGFDCSSHQRVKSFFSMTTTSKAISACEVPQYSAHTPRNVPVFVGVSARRVMRPGIMSRLPPSDGIQKA
jgi:hypothetical protein